MRSRSFGFFAILLTFLVPAYPASAQSRNSEPADEYAPQVLTLPAGTMVMVRTTQLLSSDRNRPGDEFSVVLDEPIVAQGWVVARPGQVAVGRVVDARRAGRGQDDSQLTIELSELVLVDGQQMPVRTELVQVLGRGRGRNDAAAVGATTGIGAVIGAVAGGGKGAAIGAAIGAAAGVAGVLSTPGRPTEIYPETGLTFRLEAPVTISTENGRQAFLPVERRDYDATLARNPDRYPPERVYDPPRRVRYYYAPYDYEYMYAPPYGFSAYFGYYGPAYYFYSGPRTYIRRRGYSRRRH